MEPPVCLAPCFDALRDTASPFKRNVDGGLYRLRDRQRLRRLQGLLYGDATFSSESGPLLEVKTLAGYADWMKGMFTPFPDARYELKSFAADPERNNVSAFAVVHATHTGPGGPVPPSGKSPRPTMST